MRSMVEGADSAPGLSDWFLATWGWGRVCVRPLHHFVVPLPRCAGED
jgi:hypothetical protein